MMKSIEITKSQCKRELGGLLQKFETGELDKVSIYEGDKRVAVLVSPWVMENPLPNSMDELREKFRT